MYSTEWWHKNRPGQKPPNGHATMLTMLGQIKVGHCCGVPEEELSGFSFEDRRSMITNDTENFLVIVRYLNNHNLDPESLEISAARLKEIRDYLMRLQGTLSPHRRSTPS